MIWGTIKTKECVTYISAEIEDGEVELQIGQGDNLIILRGKEIQQLRNIIHDV